MIKKIWKDPVWSKVIAVGILGILASIVTYFFGVWPAIISTLIQVWEYVLETTLIPRWLLGLMWIPCLLLVIVIFSEIKEKLSKKETVTNWKSYTRDNFFGLQWSWRYIDNKINNLHSFCPECEYQIFPKEVNGGYSAVPIFEGSCDDCGYSIGAFEGYPDDLSEKVQLKIQKAVRTGKWVNHQN